MNKLRAYLGLLLFAGHRVYFITNAKSVVLILILDVFRPFPGFQEVRLIKKEAKGGRKFYFCFVDFDSALQSTIALETLQV